MLRDKREILKEMMEDSKLPTKIINYDRTVYPSISLLKVKNGLYRLNGQSIQTATVQGKNLWSSSSYYYSHTGVGFTSDAPASFNLPINAQGTYTLSANITRYNDDVVTNPRISIKFFYTDGTNNIVTGFYNSIPADSIEHLAYVTGTSDVTKTIDNIGGWLFDYSSSTFRHIEARNIQLELGSTATNYEPFVPNSPSPDYPSDIINTTTAKTYSWTCPDNSALYNIVLADDLRSISSTEGQYDILWVNTFKNTCWIEKHINGTLLTNTSVLATQTNALISPTQLKQEFYSQNSSYEDGNLGVEHSANAPLSLEQTGKTEQNTLDGVNLLDTTNWEASATGQGLTLSYDANSQEFTINGTIGNSSSIVTYNFHKFLDVPLNLEVNTLYKLAIKYISGSISGDGKYTVFYVGQSDIVGKSVNWISCNLQESNTIASGVAVNTYLTRMWIHFNCPANTSWTFNNYKFKTMFTTSENAARAYEPYCGGMPSPNPDYPSPIQSVLSGTKVDLVGRNLIPFPYTDGDTARAGILSTVNTDRSVTSIGTTTNSSITMYILYQNLTFIAGEYTMCYEGLMSNGVSMYVLLDGKYYSVSATSKAKNFVVNTKQITNVWIQTNAPIGTYINQNVRPMILKGSYTSETLPTYHPYQSGGAALSEYDLYTGDKWNVASGEYVFDKAVYEFTGNESWTLYPRTEGINPDNIGFALYTDNILSVLFPTVESMISGVACSHFKVDSTYTAITEAIRVHLSNYSTYIAIKKSRLSSEDVAGFKAWLAAQHVTIVYQRAVPLTVQDTAHSLKSIPRHTNIFTTPASDGLTPELNVKTKIIGI